MKFDPGILRNYDIRGEYGVDFDDEFAQRLGAAVVAQFQAKTLVVARDERPSSLTLTQAVMKGIIDAGCDVIDIGEASTPFFYYVVTQHDVPAGIMVTASHMGEEFNGFKVCKHDAMTLGKNSGLAELAALIRQKELPFAATPGTISPGQYHTEHADFIISHAHLEQDEVSVKVAIDAPPMIQKELEVIFNRLGIVPVSLGYDIQFDFDADGDRLTVYNAQGKQIRGDLIGGVIAAREAKIAYDIRYSRGVIDYLKAKEITVIPSKIGHTLIKQTLKEHQADFCGEGSGHMMFRELNYAESTQLALLKILKILAIESKTIDQLVAPMETWAYSGELNTPIAGWPDSVKPILEKIKQHYPDATISELDGLKVDYPDWWFLLRASGTEPLIRLIVEARTKEMLEEKIKEVQALIAP